MCRDGSRPGPALSGGGLAGRAPSEWRETCCCDFTRGTLRSVCTLLLWGGRQANGASTFLHDSAQGVKTICNYLAHVRVAFDTGKARGAMGCMQALAFIVMITIGQVLYLIRLFGDPAFWQMQDM